MTEYNLFIIYNLRRVYEKLSLHVDIFKSTEKFCFKSGFFLMKKSSCQSCQWCEYVRHSFKLNQPAIIEPISL